jgi:hypothetical protein
MEEPAAEPPAAQHCSIACDLNKEEEGEKRSRCSSLEYKQTNINK